MAATVDEVIPTTYEANPAISEAVSNILHSSDLTSLSALVCQSDGKRAKEQRVKRPMNAFMLYAQVARRKVATKYPNLNYAKLSKTLGKIWQVLPEEERRPFIQEAERLRAQHKLKHPDYKYTPKRTRSEKKSHGMAPRKLQYENLKPEELFNILQTKCDPANSTSLPMRGMSMMNTGEKIPFNSSINFDNPPCGQSWTTSGSSNTGLNTSINPLDAAIQTLDYMESPNYVPNKTISAGVPGSDLRWFFSDQFMTGTNYAEVNHLLDTFTNPNLFLSQKQDFGVPASEPFPFFSKEPTSGFTPHATFNQLPSGMEYTQLTPLKQKISDSVENIASFFEGKPLLPSYAAI